MNDKKNIMKFRKRLRNNIKTEFDSQLAYNKKYLKAKIKYFNGKINTNFHNNKIRKKGSQCICLLVILTSSVFKQVKITILQCFQENINIFLKTKKMPKHVADNREIFSDSDREDSNQKNSNEEN